MMIINTKFLLNSVNLKGNQINAVSSFSCEKRLALLTFHMLKYYDCPAGCAVHHYKVYAYGEKNLATEKKEYIITVDLRPKAYMHDLCMHICMYGWM